MRKIIYSLLLGFFVLGYAAPSFAAEPGFGAYEDKSSYTGRKFPVRVLKQVRHASSDPNSGNLASGDIVRYSLVSDDGITVAFTNVSADGGVAGVILTTIESADATSNIFYDDVGRRNWGWLLVHGPGTVTVKAGATNAHAAGDPIYTSRDPLKACTLEDVVVSGDTGANAGYNAAMGDLFRKIPGRAGFFLDADDGTATSYDAYIMTE